MLEAMEVLTARSDFLRVQGSGRKWISRNFILQIAENSDSRLRVGYTVTKRTEKSAVKRNRIKRRLRAAAADVLPLYAKGGMDYVLVGRAGAGLCAYEEMKRDLIWCLKKTELYEKKEPRGDA